MPMSTQRRLLRRWSCICVVIVAVSLAGCLPDRTQNATMAVIHAEPSQGLAPLIVAFDAAASRDPQGAITEWLWDFGDGSGVISGRKVEHTFSTPGEFVVTLVVVGDSGVGRASTTIRTVNNPPTARIAFDPRDPFEEELIIFDGSGSSDIDGEIVDWKWEFGDGATGSGEFTSHSYDLPGDYRVRLTVRDDQGAEDTTAVTVTVRECPPGYCGRR